MTRRAHEIVGEARTAMKDRLFVVSSERVKGALQLAPDDPEVLRVTAQFLALNGQARAFPYWEQLLASGQATLTDRQELVRLALQLGRLDLSQTTLSDLLMRDPTNAVAQELALDQLLAVGNWRAAEAGARLILAQRPTAPRPRLALGRSLLASGQPGGAAEALPLLKTLATATNGAQKDALRALLTIPALPADELQRSADALFAHRDATLADRLAALDTQWRLSPNMRSELQDRAPALLDSERDEADLISVAEWLRRHGAAEQADGLLPAEVALKNESLFLARVELLAAQQRWDEAAGLVASVREIHPPDAVACASAHIAAQRGRPDDVATNLKAALEHAGLRWSRVNFIADYARQLGQTGIAVEAWGRLLDDPRYGFMAAQQLIANLPDKSFTDLERHAYRSLARLLPNDPEFQAQDAYFNLLFGENVEYALSVFQRLAAAHPESENLVVGLAFGQFRKNRVEDALSTIESRKIDWKASEPHCRAIYAAVLAANHQLRDARLIAEPIAPKSLRPQEQKLIADLVPAR